MSNTKVTEKCLAQIKNFEELQVLKLAWTRVGTQLKDVKSLKMLTTLELAGTGIAVSEVAAFPKLVSLGLSASKIQSTNEILLLKDMHQLRHLDLAQSDITVDELDVIGQLEHLQSIDVTGANISEMQRQKLQRLLPKTTFLTAGR